MAAPEKLILTVRLNKAPIIAPSIAERKTKKYSRKYLSILLIKFNGLYINII